MSNRVKLRFAIPFLPPCTLSPHRMHNHFALNFSKLCSIDWRVLQFSNVNIILVQWQRRSKKNVIHFTVNVFTANIIMCQKNEETEPVTRTKEKFFNEKEQWQQKIRNKTSTNVTIEFIHVWMREEQPSTNTYGMCRVCRVQISGSISMCLAKHTVVVCLFYVQS